jgi:hypothetical protein
MIKWIKPVLIHISKQKIVIVTFIRIRFCSLPIIDTTKTNKIAIDDTR